MVFRTSADFHAWLLPLSPGKPHGERTINPSALCRLCSDTGKHSGDFVFRLFPGPRRIRAARKKQITHGMTSVCHSHDAISWAVSLVRPPSCCSIVGYLLKCCGVDFHHTCEVFLYQVNAEWPMQQAFPHNTADQLASTWLKHGMLSSQEVAFPGSPAIPKPRSYHTNGLFRHATLSPTTRHSAFHWFDYIIPQNKCGVNEYQSSAPLLKANHGDNRNRLLCISIVRLFP